VERLAGQNAVVSGGGSGIGAACALRLAADGATVWIAEIEADAAEASAVEIARAGGQAHAIVCDVRESASVEQVQGALGGAPVAVLVNNVGHYAPAGRFAETSEEDWQALYAVNLLHVFRFTRAFLPGMIERGAGAIVNVSTVEAFRGIPANAVYSAFKAGVSQFTKSLAVEVGGHGVRVNAVAPDLIQTDQTPYDRWLSEEDRARVPSWVPLARIGQPADVADVVAFLASDEARYVTGHTIPVDGGTLAASGWYKRAGGLRWTNRPRDP
jgi:NAD(P)-dependent dehydrogenase (short-subunit alcohol dehydrogenase family)